MIVAKMSMSPFTSEVKSGPSTLVFVGHFLTNDTSRYVAMPEHVHNAHSQRWLLAGIYLLVGCECLTHSFWSSQESHLRFVQYQTQDMTVLEHCSLHQVIDHIELWFAVMCTFVFFLGVELYIHWLHFCVRFTLPNVDISTIQQLCQSLFSLRLPKLSFKQSIYIL